MLGLKHFPGFKLGSSAVVLAFLAMLTVSTPSAAQSLTSKIEQAEALLASGKLNAAITQFQALDAQLSGQKSLEAALVNYHLGDGLVRRLAQSGSAQDRQQAIAAFTKAETTFSALNANFFRQLAGNALKQLGQ